MLYNFREGTPEKGWVVVVHGLGEHIGRYKKLIGDLTNQGYGVIGFDYPGHGKSDGKRGDTSIEQVMNIIKDLTSDIPEFFLFGHSLGGLVALRYTEEGGEKVRSLIVSSPALYLEVNPFTKFIANTLGKVFSSGTINNTLNPDFISRNKEAVKRYVEDPLVHSRISFRLGSSTMENIKLAHDNAEKINVPTLILISTEDKIVPPQGARDFFEKLKIEDKKLVEFPGGYHELFEDMEHSEKFYNTIYEWINAH
ncbi:MAG TPA: lysophospholipase [Dictyoglomaceae bacterium]|nr:lysophospholipase [Dictyoglomaceae bacterium]HPP16690.1 lysophospholipase [Dictyoglomaceae bacterium]